ncbi:hypothetical protein GQX74_015593 [Glossina fuscipes]|nr:hypothetical protein GQX74_015593 [Glossina fuscipes]
MHMNGFKEYFKRPSLRADLSPTSKLAGDTSRRCIPIMLLNAIVDYDDDNDDDGDGDDDDDDDAVHDNDDDDDVNAGSSVTTNC